MHHARPARLSIQTQWSLWLVLLWWGQCILRAPANSLPGQQYVSNAGASILPEAMMHFPLFQISSYFPKKFQTPWNIFPILPPFPTNFSIFIHQNFWWLFLVIDHKFWIYPYFYCFSTFPPYFEKIIISPYFSKFPPWFRKITCFFLHTLCFSFPPLIWPWCIYASHNACTGRPWSNARRRHTLEERE